MTDPGGQLSIRASLIEVKDLEASSAFYRALFGLEEVARDPELVILGRDDPAVLLLMLRAGHPHAVRGGQDVLGLRALVVEASPFAELERIESYLRDQGAFVRRNPLAGTDSFEVVVGTDPDRLPLVFLGSSSGEALSGAPFQEVSAAFYTLDL